MCAIALSCLGGARLFRPRCAPCRQRQAPHAGSLLHHPRGLALRQSRSHRDCVPRARLPSQNKKKMEEAKRVKQAAAERKRLQQAQASSSDSDSDSDSDSESSSD